MSLAALARALKGGAVHFVSELISIATHPFLIINRIRSAFRGLNMGEISQVYWQGVGAYSSAQYFSSIGTSVSLDPANIQTNPFLFQGQQLGDRFRYGAQVTYRLPWENFERQLTINVDDPQSLSLDQIRQRVQEHIMQFNYENQRRVGTADPADIIPIEITIQFAEKAW